jgi:hypothetical protein
MIRVLTLAVFVATLAAHVSAFAQEADDEESASDALGVPSPPAGYGSPRGGECVGRRGDAEETRPRWPDAPPGGPIGVVNPRAGIVRDHGLLIGGTVLALSSYVTGVVTSAPLAFAGGCSPWRTCNVALGALSFLPLGTWAGGFSGTGASWVAFVTGGIFTTFEIIGVLILLAGALHNHPRLEPGPTVAGSAQWTAQGLEIAF